MPRLSSQSSIALIAIALGVGLLWWVPNRDAAVSSGSQALAQAPADAKLVALEITIEDEESGLRVHATRKVPAGISGIDAMRATVAIETKEFEGLGLFVTSLCGVKPAAGKFWSPTVDGEKSQVGIARIKIEKDTHLRWKTQSAQGP
jgi:hypothetical protein